MLFVLLGIGVVAVAASLFFDRLGDRALRGDEAIHAQVAREAAASGDWLPLRFDGGVYTAKPPLKILAVAWIFDRFGVSEFNARVLDPVFGVGTVLLVFLFGARCFGSWTGALAALLLATTPLYVLRHGVREGVQDSALVFLLTAALMLYAHRLAGGRSGRLALAGAGVAVGLASLVKGPVAALALPVLALWESFSHRRRPGGLRAGARDVAVVALLGLAFYLPYALAAHAWTGGRLDQILYRDVVVRATEGVDPRHSHGPTFYLRQLWRELGPWLLATVPAAVVVFRGRRAGEDRERAALIRCGLWALTLLAVLSVPTSKLEWYLYPAYPAFALLLAGGTGVAVRWALGWRPVRGVGVALTGVLVAVAVAGLWQRYDHLEDRLDATPREPLIARYVRAIEQGPPHQVVILRDTAIAPQQLFYLLPLGRRTWSIPDSFRTEEPEGCRYVVRERSALPHATHPAPGARALPLEWPEPEAWLLDLDGCLPPWL